MSNTTGRFLPHNLEAEQGLISCLFMDEDKSIISQCIAKGLTADSFFHPNHQLVYQATVDIYKANRPVDLVMLSEQLKAMGKLETIGGVAALSDFTRLIETTTHAVHWIEIVRDLALRRKLIRITTNATESAYSSDGETSSLTADLVSQINGLWGGYSDDSIKTMADVLKDNKVELDNYISGSKESIGLSTGYIGIDKITDGLPKASMVVIAGRPSSGKTALGINIVENIMLGHNPVNTLVLSLEMRAVELSKRMIASLSGVGIQKIRDGLATAEDRQAMYAAEERIAKFPMWIKDSKAKNIFEIKENIKQFHKRDPLQLVVLDYLQLIQGSNPKASREEQVAEISINMKELARDLLCPVMVLAQLNRASESENRKPRMSDLRNSGQIEMDADIILLIHKEGEGEPNKREIIVDKNRNGRKANLELYFNAEITKFSTMSYNASVPANAKQWQQSMSYAEPARKSYGGEE